MRTGRNYPHVLVVAGRHPAKYLGGGYVSAWQTTRALARRCPVRALVVVGRDHVHDVPEAIRVPDCAKHLYPLLFFIYGLPSTLFWATHVHAHDRAGLLLGVLARCLGKPFFFTVYNGLLEPRKWCGTPFLMKLDWLCARIATRVFTMSEASRRQVQSAYSIPAERIVVTGGGVDDGFLRPPNGRKHPGNVLLFAGRLDDAKGADIAVRALALVRQSRPDATLLIVGEGPKEARLRELAVEVDAGDSVTFMGFVPPRDMVAVYDRASVLVLPTAGESFGLVVVEGMSRGTVPVVTAIGGVREIIANGVNGIMVDTRSPESVAQAVLSLLNDPRLYARLSDAARRIVITAFTWDIVAARCLATLTHRGRTGVPKA